MTGLILGNCFNHYLKKYYSFLNV